MIPFVVTILSGLLAFKGYLAVLHGAGGEALLYHLLAAGMALGAHRLTRPLPPLGIYELAIALLVPFVGGGLLLLTLLGVRFSRSEAVAEEYAHYLDAEERLGDQAIPTLRGELEVNPERLEALADILRSQAGISEKRLAIEALAIMETPKSVAALRGALTSPSTEVRFYAASVLGSLEERLSQRLASLEEDVTLGRRTDPAVEIDLAQSYFDFAYFGLVEGGRQQDYLRRAYTHVQRANAAQPAARGWLLEGRTLLELGRPREAEAAFTRLLETRPQDLTALLWRAESRFDRGAFAGVTRDCQRALAVGRLPDRVEPAVHLWGARSAAVPRRSFRRSNRLSSRRAQRRMP